MIREDRELLVERARLNSDVVPLAFRTMDGSVSAEEQYGFAQRLSAMATRLQARASVPGRVVEGDVVPRSEHEEPAAPVREP